MVSLCVSFSIGILVFWLGGLHSGFDSTVGVYFKTMPNSIKFYKGVFLRVIPVRIIVP